MLGGETEVTFCDAQGTKQRYRFTDKERLSLILFEILYASRCNNFHGMYLKQISLRDGIPFSDSLAKVSMSIYTDAIFVCERGEGIFVNDR